MGKKRQEFICMCQSIGDDIWWRETAYMDGRNSTPVVRCADCTNISTEWGFPMCTKFGIKTTPDGFCAWGETEES